MEVSRAGCETGRAGKYLSLYDTFWLAVKCLSQRRAGERVRADTRIIAAAMTKCLADGGAVAGMCGAVIAGAVVAVDVGVLGQYQVTAVGTLEEAKPSVAHLKEI